jgi:hypothetical protein
MMAWSKALTTLDDRALSPVVGGPEDIDIIVAGGAGKPSLCIPSFGITRSVTKPSALTPQWEQSLAAVRRWPASPDDPRHGRRV